MGMGGIETGAVSVAFSDFCGKFYALIAMRWPKGAAMRVSWS